MINYVEYLKIPAWISLAIICVIFLMQLIGEILEFKGKIVPEAFKIRKYFARKKAERVAFGKMTELLDEYQQMAQMIKKTEKLLAEFNSHYNKDNIVMRDKWMRDVNDHISCSEKRQKEQDSLMRELNKKLDENNMATLSILIENKRSAIIDFASKVIDENCPVTREHFNRIFKMHEEYEDIIQAHDLTNGEVDIAYRIIVESYENHMKNHTFVEDIRGYQK